MDLTVLHVDLLVIPKLILADVLMKRVHHVDKKGKESSFILTKKPVSYHT